jgi:hypothetical protein
MLDDTSLQELAESIRVNGLREPIVLYEGIIIDGRNRYAACGLADVEPTFVEYDGAPDDIVDWIIDKNIHRRHLTTSQRAMVADLLSGLTQGRPSKLLKSKQFSTQAEAASKLKVSRSAVQQARKVRESGDASLIAQVENGELSVSAAAKQLKQSSPPPPPATPPEERCPARGTPHECAACPEGRGHHWDWLQGSSEPEPLLTCIHCHETIWDGPLPPGAPPRPGVEVTPDADNHLELDEVDEVDEPLPPAELGGLAPEERAPLDAYWTPAPVALACARWLWSKGLVNEPELILEPAVGGGAWVQAARSVWPGATLRGLDLDPSAPGLEIVDQKAARDFLEVDPDELGHYDLILGNPPYASGQILPWLDRSLQHADVVAYLLRETITGTATRLGWWLEHRPRFIAKVCPRPKWEGPGARDTSDFADTVLVVWTRGRFNRLTEWDWIDTSPTDDAPQGRPS